MAPEMFCHKRHYTRKVDLWSVGVIIYDMITLGERLIKIEVDCKFEEIDAQIREKIEPLNVSS